MSSRLGIATITTSVSPKQTTAIDSALIRVITVAGNHFLIKAHRLLITTPTLA